MQSSVFRTLVLAVNRMHSDIVARHATLFRLVARILR